MSSHAEASLSPLELLRLYCVSDRLDQIQIRGLRIAFGKQFSYHQDVRTPLRVSGQDNTFYRLQSLLFFLRSRNESHPTYIKSAMMTFGAGHVPVKKKDRQEIEEYLTGAKNGISILMNLSHRDLNPGPVGDREVCRDPHMELMNRTQTYTSIQDPPRSNSTWTQSQRPNYYDQRSEADARGYHRGNASSSGPEQRESDLFDGYNMRLPGPDRAQNSGLSGNNNIPYTTPSYDRSINPAPSLPHIEDSVMKRVAEALQSPLLQNSMKNSQQEPRFNLPKPVPIAVAEPPTPEPVPAPPASEAVPVPPASEAVPATVGSRQAGPGSSRSATNASTDLDPVTVEQELFLARLARQKNRDLEQRSRQRDDERYERESSYHRRHHEHREQGRPRGLYNEYRGQYRRSSSPVRREREYLQHSPGERSRHGPDYGRRRSESKEHANERRDVPSERTKISPAEDFRPRQKARPGQSSPSYPRLEQQQSPSFGARPPSRTSQQYAEASSTQHDASSRRQERDIEAVRGHEFEGRMGSLEFPAQEQQPQQAAYPQHEQPSRESAGIQRYANITYPLSAIGQQQQQPQPQPANVTVPLASLLASQDELIPVRFRLVGIDSKRCHVCGSSGHTLPGGDCPVWRREIDEQGRDFSKWKKKRLCEYPPCTEPDRHTIKICPTLHALCRGGCGRRGHLTRDCLDHSKHEWQRLYEKYSPHGHNTIFGALYVDWAFEGPQDDLVEVYRDNLGPRVMSKFALAGKLVASLSQRELAELSAKETFSRGPERLDLPRADVCRLREKLGELERGRSPRRFSGIILADNKEEDDDRENRSRSASPKRRTIRSRSPRHRRTIRSRSPRHRRTIRSRSPRTSSSPTERGRRKRESPALKESRPHGDKVPQRDEIAEPPPADEELPERYRTFGLAPERHCHFCGAPKVDEFGVEAHVECDRKKKMFDVCGPDFARWTKVLCDYPPCPTNTLHFIRACPMLHSLCRKDLAGCGKRGHTNLECNLNAQDKWREMYDAFSGQGQLSLRGREHDDWSFDGPKDRLVAVFLPGVGRRHVSSGALNGRPLEQYQPDELRAVVSQDMVGLGPRRRPEAAALSLADLHPRLRNVPGEDGGEMPRADSVECIARSARDMLADRFMECPLYDDPGRRKGECTYCGDDHVTKMRARDFERLAMDITRKPLRPGETKYLRLCHKFQHRLENAGPVSGWREAACQYPGCLAPNFHCTESCPYLHRLCWGIAGCGKRGHAVGHCYGASLERMRSIYQEFAPIGILTRRLKLNPDWNFDGPMESLDDLAFYRLSSYSRHENKQFIISRSAILHIDSLHIKKQASDALWRELTA